MELTNQQKYWITGATSGIGRALCIELAQLEHKLIISSRNAEELGKLALEYPKLIQILPCDVSNNEEMAELFSTKMPTLKNLDGPYGLSAKSLYLFF